MASVTPTGILRSRMSVVVIGLLVAALGAATPASADPPPAAAGTTAHGFLLKRGALMPIDHPDATTIPATPTGQAGTATAGINDRGEILGLYEGPDRVVRHFLLNRRGRFTEIDDPPDGPDGTAFDEINDINNRGEMVGWYNDDQGSVTTGFLRTRTGRFKSINVPDSQGTGPFRINDRRQVVGIYIDGDAQPEPGGILPVHGFLWDAGEFETIDVAGAAATLILGINNRGQMVGSWIDKRGGYHGFLRDRNGTVTTLPDVPGAEPTAGGTQPSSINDRGRITGLAYDAQGGSRAFVYKRGRYTLFEGTRDATYTRAVDINNRGRIVGDYGTQLPTADSEARARHDLLGGLPPGLGGG